MGIYATQAEVEAYIEGWVTDNPAVLERQIERAERDLDTHCFGTRALEPNGRRFDPATLLQEERDALSRATCAQVEYREMMGPEHFVQAQREKVIGKNFEAHGKLPIVGPQTWRELTYTGLLTLATHTGGDRTIRSDADLGWRDP